MNININNSGDVLDNTFLQGGINLYNKFFNTQDGRVISLSKKLAGLCKDQSKNSNEYFKNLIKVLKVINHCNDESIKNKNRTNYFFKLLGENGQYADDFVNIVKIFESIKDNEYMCKVNGQDQPGIKICQANVIYSNETTMWLSDISNTCEVGKILKDQWDRPSEKKFDLKNGPMGLFKQMKKLTDFDEWAKMLNDSYALTPDDFKNILEDVPRCRNYSIARILAPEKISFYQMTFRGKGSGDLHDIGDEEQDLFPLAIKNNQIDGINKPLFQYYQESFDHHGSLDSEKANLFRVNHLLDRISYSTNNEAIEGDDIKFSKLNNLGKKITKRVLEWLLDSQEHKITENNDGKITVNKIIGRNKATNDDARFFYGITEIKKKIEDEISKYTDEVLNVFKTVLLKLNNDDINTLKQIKPENKKGKNNQNKETQMSFEMKILMDTLHSKVENKNDISSNEEKSNLVFMLDCIFKSALKNFLPSLELGNNKVNKWLIDELRNRFDKNDLSFIRREMIKNMLERAVEIGKSGLENKNNKFDFETANLQSIKLLNEFDKYFANLKSKISAACNKKLPNDREGFEKIFATVDCDSLIKFMYDKMNISIDKCFLKKSIGALLYTNVEAVHGDDGNGNAEKVAARLSNRRNTFLDADDYSGRDFIREATLLSKDAIDTEDKPLPKNFYDYDSDDQEKMFTVVHYIQAFWQSILARKEICYCPSNTDKDKKNMLRSLIRLSAIYILIEGY